MAMHNAHNFPPEILRIDTTYNTARLRKSQSNDFLSGEGSTDGTCNNEGLSRRHEQSCLAFSVLVAILIN